MPADTLVVGGLRGAVGGGQGPALVAATPTGRLLDALQDGREMRSELAVRGATLGGIVTHRTRHREPHRAALDPWT
jgi:hypothetical protein